MKKYILCFLFLFVAVIGMAASPWCALEDCTPKQSSAQKTSSHKKNQPAPQPKPSAAREDGFLQVVKDERANRILLPRLMRGDTFYFAVQPVTLGDKEGEYVLLSDFPEERIKRAKSKTVSVLQEWFTTAVKYIDPSVKGALTKEDRTEEFADILPFLRKKITKRDAQLEDPDVDLILTITDSQDTLEDYCGKGSAACEFSGEEDGIIQIVVLDKTSMATYRHEMGHALGLADLYKKGFKENGDKHVHSSNIRGRDSIMKDDGDKITCDDIDGFINLIDLWTANPSERVTQGWRSLCPDSDEYYRNGNSVGKKEMKERRQKMVAKQKEGIKERLKS